MRTIRWFVGQLPGVRPRLASVAIKNGVVPGAMDDVHFMHGDLGPSMLVGPDAAKLILRAYLEGRLPMEPGAEPARAPAIDEYLAKAEALHKEAQAHRDARSGADPFADWRAMEEAFRRTGHPVAEFLDVGGRRIERRTHGHRDPRPHEIRFHWTDADGTPWLLDRRHGRNPDD